MIIGITGTIGSGKTTVVDFLKKNDFEHYSVRDFLIEEIKKRNLNVDRRNMQSVANDIRERNSPSYIIDTLYKKAKEQGGNAVIESIRCVKEVESLKRNTDFFLLAVDADIKLRFKRVTGRGSETDNIGFDQFVDEEQKEMSNSNPAMQNIKGCMKLADYTIQNNGSLEELEDNVGNALWEFKNLEKKRKNTIW